jgi:hypothetical protein
MVAEMSGPLAFQFLRKESPVFEQRGLKIPILLFNDPTTFVLSAIDELMFRIAVQTAYNNTFGVAFDLVKMSTYESIVRNITQGDTTSTMSSTTISMGRFNGTRFPSWRIVDMDVVHSVPVYKASYPFLGGAISAVLLAIILVIPLFHGFWRLGRQTSIGPLETAAALGAPLLANVPSSNDTAREIMKTAGMQRVRYGEMNASRLCDTLEGEVEAGSRQRRLQFGRVEQVDRPTSGSIYS